MSYDVSTYWSAVGDAIERRGGVVAGDDAPFFRYKRRLFVELLKESLPLSGHSILEVGCGPGGNLDTLSAAGPGIRRLTGVDVADTMVRLSREKGHEVFKTDGRTLPFHDDEFDVVFSATVLQHNPAIDTLLSEMCRVASEQVCLFEDTAAAHHRAGPAYFLRSPAEYQTVAESNDWHLVEVAPMRIYASDFAHRAVMGLLARGTRAEGEPIPPTALRAEEALETVTTRLDRFTPARRALTKMVFEPGS